MGGYCPRGAIVRGAIVLDPLKYWPTALTKTNRENKIYYETKVQLLYLSGNHLPWWWFIKINWSHWKT